MYKLSKQRLNEATVKIPFGCLMVTFALPKWEWFVSKLVNPNDYEPQRWMEGNATYDQMHITVLYGLDPKVTLDEVRPLLLPIDEINVDFKAINHFPNAGYGEGNRFDLVKFEVESEQLRALNKVVSTLPHKEFYAHYHPHATIAYVKVGEGEKYDRAIKPFTLKPDGYLFTAADGSTVSFII
jgi:2'-5' RNA ligase